MSSPACVGDLRRRLGREDQPLDLARLHRHDLDAAGILGALCAASMKPCHANSSLDPRIGQMEGHLAAP